MIPQIDLARCYHPVAFMLTSHESHDDYVYFYRSMAMIVAALNIPLTIPYLMQDASKAEYAGIKSVHPNFVLIMCYFHVKENIQKNWSKYDVPLEHRTKISNDITFLHQSLSYQ